MIGFDDSEGCFGYVFEGGDQFVYCYFVVGVEVYYLVWLGCGGYFVEFLYCGDMCESEILDVDVVVQVGVVLCCLVGVCQVEGFICGLGLYDFVECM